MIQLNFLQPFFWKVYFSRGGGIFPCLKTSWSLPDKLHSQLKKKGAGWLVYSYYWQAICGWTALQNIFKSLTTPGVSSPNLGVTADKWACWEHCNMFGLVQTTRDGQLCSLVSQNSYSWAWSLEFKFMNLLLRICFVQVSVTKEHSLRSGEQDRPLPLASQSMRSSWGNKQL